MRELTRFSDQAKAETLGAALYISGIDNKVDEGRKGDFILWVHDETQMDNAKELLTQFEANPFDERFQAAVKQADVRKREAERKDKILAKKNKKIRTSMAARTKAGMGKLTIGIMVFTVMVFILTDPRLGASTEVYRLLKFDDSSIGEMMLHGLFLDIRSGQVWRLITPIFLHGSFMHIGFNLWCMSSFGSQVERVQSWKVLLLLVLVTALVSNITQYLVSGPNFVGMSGVVYGVFGYLWMQSQFAPRSGYFMPKGTIIWFMGFFLICFTGVLEYVGLHVANAAHAGGLGAGMLWGIARAKLSKG